MRKTNLKIAIKSVNDPSKERKVKTFTKVKWVKLTYIIISVLALAFVFYGFSKFDRGVGQTQMFMMTIGVMLLVIVPKLLITFIMLLEDTTADMYLILEDDATLNPVVNERFLRKMMELMERNKIDILQIGFIEHLYSFSLRSGVLESIINVLNGRGRKDPSGFRYVIGEFRSGAHAYIVSSHLAEGISSAVSQPPLLPWDDWLGLMAKAQTHRNFRIARLVKSVVSQASRSSQNSKIDSDIEGP
jgi:hypothetical protein